MNRLLPVIAVLYNLVGPAAAWIHGAPSGSVPGGPGLVVGTYGSTTASGWTTIGPSDGTLACACFTNIIYVSDSMGDDNRDGSTPTFVDDNDTAQFVLSSAATPVVNDVYKTPNNTQVTVAAVPKTGSGNYTFWQMKSRTGTPDLTGTLTCVTTCIGPAGPLTYTAMTLGIHGPVKTIIKAISSGLGTTGPGPYDLDHTGGPFTPNGDGTGLGTIGNWRTAGSVAASFGLRNGFPDWTLLRMGDTFTGQAFETNYNAGAGGSDNFQWNGYSEQEPMVLSAYDEAVPVTTPDVGSGARARPIILVPSATSAYAAMQGAGNMHLFEGRDGIRMQGGGTNVAIIGLDFYSAQRNPNGAYVGSSNVFSNSSIITPGGVSGLLIEDTHTRWTSAGISINNSSPNFDVNIRRSQMDHCYGNRGLGTNDDDISPAGGVGGLMSPGFSFEENVLDLCGYSDATFTSGDSRSRNAYIQWNAVFGNRRGNTSTRSGSENFQFRSGGVVDNNFTYHGSYGFDVGHQEGDPTLASNTVVTNNVVMTPANPIGLPQIGINFSNTNNITASNNLVANEDGSLNPFVYVQTDSYDGGTNNLTISNAGTGGTPGTYGCVGGTGWFTGGSGTATGTYNFTIGVSGSLTGYGLQEPVTDTFTAGDVLTPVANSPSLSYTGGTTLTAAGSGGTPGAYGFGGSLCAINPTNPGIGGATGIVLTNFSGSMAGTGARALFDINGSGIVDAYNIIGAGHGYQVGDVLTASFGGITGVRIRVDAVGNLSGWQIIVQSVISQGTHGLTWTGNTVFNWPGSGPPSTGDNGGTHDSPLPGGAGSGTANTWTGNANCTAAQFTGAISGGTTLATSSLLQGTIANGQNLAGVGVAANTSIVSGGPTSWTITPSQSNVSAETMYSYTCTPTTVFPHPELTVDTYAALLGLSPASIDGYMTAALNNAKWNWNPALTANNGINPYIRHGFGMTP